MPPPVPHPIALQVYLQYLSAWRGRTGQLLTHYVHCDRWSVWGRWGAQEYPTQPRAQVCVWVDGWALCCAAAAAAAACAAGPCARHAAQPAAASHVRNSCRGTFQPCRRPSWTPCCITRPPPRWTWGDAFRQMQSAPNERGEPAPPVLPWLSGRGNLLLIPIWRHFKPGLITCALQICHWKGRPPRSHIFVRCRAAAGVSGQSWAVGLHLWCPSFPTPPEQRSSMSAAQQLLAQPPRGAQQTAPRTGALCRRALPATLPRRRSWRCRAAQVRQRCCGGPQGRHRLVGGSAPPPPPLPSSARLDLLARCSTCRWSCRSGMWCCLMAPMGAWRWAASARCGQRPQAVAEEARAAWRRLRRCPPAVLFGSCAPTEDLRLFGPGQWCA